MRIAIMQPYFLPYAGYFRLFAAADLFVMYDCVQFVRRGWVHRNRLHNRAKDLEWLTLPLKKAPQDIKIHSLQFAENSQQEWQNRLQRFPRLADATSNELVSLVQTISDSPLEYISKTLKKACELLSLKTEIIYSSNLNLLDSLKGEDRIIAIAKHFGATEYINPPGGKELYRPGHFTKNGLKLHFLSDYHGPYESIIERMIDPNNIPDLKKDILSQTTFC